MDAVQLKTQWGTALGLSRGRSGTSATPAGPLRAGAANQPSPLQGAGPCHWTAVAPLRLCGWRVGRAPQPVDGSPGQSWAGRAPFHSVRAAPAPRAPVTSLTPVERPPRPAVSAIHCAAGTPRTGRPLFPIGKCCGAESFTSLAQGDMFVSSWSVFGWKIL